MMDLVAPLIDLVHEASPLTITLASVTIGSGLLYLWTRWWDFFMIFATSILYAMPFMFR